MNMKKEYETIKCKKCGYENVKHAEKCKKCGTAFKATLKSCPRCAKRNDINANSCVSCGYRFDKKEASVWVNLGITIIFIIASIVLVLLNKEFIVEKVHWGLKIFAIVMLVFIALNTLTYGKKDIVQLPGDESELLNENVRHFNFSTLILILATIIVIIACIVCYFVFYR